jgi:hypothetical protein
MRPPRLTVQSLEPREVPAGVIAVSFVTGALALRGDDFGNQVTIDVGTDVGGAPRVRLIPDATTAIDDLSDPKDPVPGEEVILPGAPVSLRAVLAGGDDGFLLLDATSLRLPGGADFDLGDGDNTLDLSTTNGTLSFGALTVKAGDGFDTVSIKSPRDAASGIATGKRQHQPVSFSFGDGGYQAAVDYFNIPGRGGFLVTAGAGGGNFDAVGQKVAGPLVGTLGTGDHSWSWGESNLRSIGIRGPLPGVGPHVRLADSEVTGNVMVVGGTVADLSTNAVTIGGSVTVQKKWLPANFRFGPAIATALLSNTKVGGAVLVTADGGSSRADLVLGDSSIRGPVTVSNIGPNGQADLIVQDASVAAPIRVVTSGPGETMAEAEFFGFTVAHAVSVVSTGDATLGVDGALRVSADVQQLLRGDVTVRAKDAAKMTLKQRPGLLNDTLSARSATISGFAGATLEMIDAATLGLTGNLAVTSAAVAVLNDPFGLGSVLVAGDVTVAGSDGAIVDAGNRWVADDLSVSSRFGEALLMFDVPVLSLNGNLTVHGGHSANMTVTPGAPATIEGALRVTGGAGPDIVMLSDLTIREGVSLDLGDGNNFVEVRKTFVIPHVLEKSGRISITSGTGDDSYTFRDVEVRGATILRTGAGADEVSIDSATLAAVTVDLGAGDDVLLLATLAGSDEPGTLKGMLKVRAGAGNDFLGLGRSLNAGGDDQSKVVFHAAGNLIDGGPGMDVFDRDTQQVELIPPATLTLLSWEVDP